MFKIYRHFTDSLNRERVQARCVYGSDEAFAAFEALRRAKGSTRVVMYHSGHRVRTWGV